MTTSHSYPRFATTFVICLGLALAGWRTASACDMPKTAAVQLCLRMRLRQAQASQRRRRAAGRRSTSVAPVRYFNGDIRMVGRRLRRRGRSAGCGATPASIATPCPPTPAITTATAGWSSNGLMSCGKARRSTSSSTP